MSILTRLTLDPKTGELLWNNRASYVNSRHYAGCFESRFELERYMRSADVHELVFWELHNPFYYRRDLGTAQLYVSTKIRVLNRFVHYRVAVRAFNTYYVSGYAAERLELFGCQGLIDCDVLGVIVTSLVYRGDYVRQIPFGNRENYWLHMCAWIRFQLKNKQKQVWSLARLSMFVLDSYYTRRRFWEALDVSDKVAVSEKLYRYDP